MGMKKREALSAKRFKKDISAAHHGLRGLAQ